MEQTFAQARFILWCHIVTAITFHIVSMIDVKNAFAPACTIKPLMQEHSVNAAPHSGAVSLPSLVTDISQ